MKKSVILKFIPILFVSFLMLSCENFFSGSLLKQEIEKTVDYVTTENITILISADEGTGSTVPVGNYTDKLGYEFEISFQENKEYSFVKWVAVDKNDSSKLITTGIDFENAASSKTKLTVNSKDTNIRILPLCIQRIAISGEPSPKYEANGVSRDTPIIVQFTKEPDPKSFYFTENELPVGSRTFVDGNNNIYAYMYDEQVYLKNISITDANGISLAEHFEAPVIDGKMVTFAVDKTNMLSLPSGSDSRKINVVLSKSITDTNGIEMSSDKSWFYIINESTNDKASVTISCRPAEGSIIQGTSKGYSIGEKFNLTFSENPDFQFVKWDYKDSYVRLADDKSMDTTVTILKKVSSTTISAICAPRMSVTEFFPVNDSGENKTVCKNSSIVIKFNQPVPTDPEGLKQLERISIAVGGSPVNGSFLSPEVNDDTITFAADMSNMLDVAEGQIKTVTVAIPADFYYLLEDGTKVTLGGNGKTFSYKVDYTTLTKAEVNFSAPSGSGTVTPGGSGNKYSIGQEVNISFDLNEGYIFNGWRLTAGGEPVDEDKIRIADASALSTKLYIYEAVSAVSVIADCSQKLSVSSIFPNAAVNNKDSDIKITFNKNLSADCEKFLDAIKVTIDGVSVDSCYKDRSIKDSVVTLKNTTLLDVHNTQEKAVVVSLPKDFFYMDGSHKIDLESAYSFNFRVNSTTSSKASINFEVIDGESGESITLDSNGKSSAGKLNVGDCAEYNLGETITLSFLPTSEYQFYSWACDVSDVNPIDLTSITNNITDLIISNACENLTISAIVYKRPALVMANCSPYSTNDSAVYPKNTAIQVCFDHEIAEKSVNNIKLESTLMGFRQSTYFDTALSADKKKLNFTNKKLMSVIGDCDMTVIVSGDVYYLAKDGVTEIKLGNTYSWTYKIDNTTVTKAGITFDNSEAANIGLMSPSGQKDYNLGESFELTFTEKPEYQFNGWKITGLDSKNPQLSFSSDDLTQKTLTVYVKAAASGIEIKPDCTLRPDFKAGTVQTPAFVNGGVEKDSAISFTLNQNVNLASLKAGLNITSAVGMTEVNMNEYFDFDNLEYDTKTNVVVLPAVEDNLIDLGTSKFIDLKVSIADTVYAGTASSATYVKAGGLSYVYRVNNTTAAKGNVYFDNADAANIGNITPAGARSYNIGDTFTVSFDVKLEYQFNGWTVTGLSNTDPEIEFESDLTNLTITGTVKSQVESVSIKPNCSLRPDFKAGTVQSPAFINGGVEKDSAISFTLNQNVNLASLKAGLNITSVVGMTEVNMNEYFDFDNLEYDTKTNVVVLPAVEGNLIDLGASKFIDLKVSIADTVYAGTASSATYVKAGGLSYVYRVNNTTAAKGNVYIDNSDAANIGTITPAGTNVYNIGDTFTVRFDVKPEYQFNGWTVTGLSNTDPEIEFESDLTNLTITGTVKSQVESVSIKPNCSLRPDFKAGELTLPAYSNGGVQRDSAIKFTLNTNVNRLSLISGIQITTADGLTKLNDYFDVAHLSYSSSTGVVEIQPVTGELIDLGGKSTLDIKVTIADSVYAFKDNLKTFVKDGGVYYTYRINETSNFVVPAVANKTPTYKASGVTKFEKIKIEMTKEIPALKSCILVSSNPEGDENINDWFDIDVTDNFLTLTPNAKFDTMISKLSLADVYVFMSTYVDDDDGVGVYKFYHNTNDSSYTLKTINRTSYLQLTHVRYNNEGEEIKPVVSSLSVNGYFGKLSNEEWTEEDNDAWTVANAEKNHCNNSISFTCSAKDEESGIKSLRVYETLIRNDEAKPITSSRILGYEYEDFTRDSEDSDLCYFTDSGDEEISYNFKSEIDGLIKLEFVAVDKQNNESVAKTYYAIRDTSFKFANCISIKASGVDYRSLYENGPYEYSFVFDNCSSNGAKGDMYLGSVQKYDYTYRKYVNYGRTDAVNMKIAYATSMDYDSLPTSIDDDNVTVVTEKSSSKQCCYITPADMTKYLYLRFYAVDAVGNEDYVDAFIPPYRSMLGSYTENVYAYDSRVGSNRYFDAFYARPDYGDELSDKFNYRIDYKYYTYSKDTETEEYVLKNTNSSNAGGEYKDYPCANVNTRLRMKLPHEVLVDGLLDPILRPQLVYEFGDIYSVTTGSVYLSIAAPVGPAFDISGISGDIDDYTPGFSVMSYEPGEKSSGQVKVAVELDSDTDYSYTHYLKTPDGVLHKFDSEGKVSITATCDTNSYLISVIAMDSDGNKVESDKMDISAGLSANDTKGPVLSFDGNYSDLVLSWDGMSFIASGYTEASGMKKVSEDDPRGYVQCYYNHGATSQVAEITATMKTKLSSYPFRVLKGFENSKVNLSTNYVYNPGYSSKSYILPLVDVEDGTPIAFYFVFEDTKGNTNEGCFISGSRGKYNRVLTAKPQVSFGSKTDASDKSFVVTCEQDDNLLDNAKYTATISYFDPVQNGWVFAAVTNFTSKYKNSSYTNNAGTDTILVDGEFSIPDASNYNGFFGNVDLTDKFTRTVIYANKTVAGTAEACQYFSYPTYKYTGDVKLKLKSFTESSTGFSVLSDQPVYIHALASAKNRSLDENGNKLSDEEALARWERHGEKIRPGYGTSPGITYNPYDEIMDGDYYVVVAYYADNTFIMSDVKHKPAK